MHSRFLAVLGLCIAVLILTAADAAPRRHLGSKNDYDYGRLNKHGHPNKHSHDKHPSNYRRRLEDANAKSTESFDYDYGHDDCDYKGYADSYSYGNKGYSGGDCDDYGYKGYGYSYDYKSYDNECDDYSDDYYGHGNDYYGYEKGYGYYPDYSYSSGNGYGSDNGFYPDYYSSYDGIYGYGYPGYGFPGYFGYESTTKADTDAKEFDAATEKDITKSAATKDTKASADEAKPKSDVASKSKGK